MAKSEHKVDINDRPDLLVNELCDMRKENQYTVAWSDF
jgi:hypothetical protein